MKKSLIILSAVLIGCAGQQETTEQVMKLTYPETTKGDVVDEYF